MPSNVQVKLRPASAPVKEKDAVVELEELLGALVMDGASGAWRSRVKTDETDPLVPRLSVAAIRSV